MVHLPVIKKLSFHWRVFRALKKFTCICCICCLYSSLQTDFLMYPTLFLQLDTNQTLMYSLQGHVLFTFSFSPIHTPRHRPTTGNCICDLDNDIATRGLSLQPLFSEVTHWGHICHFGSHWSVKGALSITICSSGHWNLCVTVVLGEPMCASLDFPVCLKARTYRNSLCQCVFSMEGRQNSKEQSDIVCLYPSGRNNGSVSLGGKCNTAAQTAANRTEKGEKVERCNLPSPVLGEKYMLGLRW